MVETEEERRQRLRERYWKDPEKYRKQAREYAEKNKEARLAYRVKNRKKINAHNRLYREANRDTENAKSVARDRKIKTAVMAHYSKKLSDSDIPCCNCCGENQFLIFLTIDHIKGWKNYNEPDLSKRRGSKRLEVKDFIATFKKIIFRQDIKYYA